MVVQVCFPGNSVPHGQSGELMFLHDIRCIFPSGISSRKSLAKFAFQELMVSLCFCQRSQRVGAALEFQSRSLESLSSKKGQVAAKCYFLVLAIPWKQGQSGTWSLSSPSAAPAPMELGTKEPKTSPGIKSGKRSCAGKGSVQRLFLLHFSGLGFGGFPLGREGALECCPAGLTPVFFSQQQLTAMI